MLKVLSIDRQLVLADSVRASSSYLCRAERQGFEPCRNPILFISNIPFVLYEFALYYSFSILVLQIGHLPKDMQRLKKEIRYMYCNRYYYERTLYYFKAL